MFNVGVACASSRFVDLDEQCQDEDRFRLQVVRRINEDSMKVALRQVRYKAEDGLNNRKLLKEVIDEIDRIMIELVIGLKNEE